MAVCLPVLIAVVAIAVDLGLMFDRRRHAQAAADAAALAAAGELFKTFTNATRADNGLDLDGAAAARARAVAADNGYPDGGPRTSVAVHIPPQTGPYKGERAYAEVVLEYRQSRNFSAIFGSGDMPIRARAVARGRWVPDATGIIILDPTGARALTVSGGARGEVPNAAVIVNSTDPAAAYGEGTTPVLSAGSFEVTGDVSMNGGGTQFQGPIHTDVEPTPDPYRNLPQPDPLTMPVRSKATATVVDHGFGYVTYYLQPGVYDGGLQFDGKSSVIMAPGVYYMRGNSDGGGFRFSGNSATRLVATEVMLFNDRGTNTVTNPGNDAYPQISISGQAQVTWTPPASGTYKGISFFQARDQDMTIYVAGTGGLNVSGVYYAASALVDIAGSGTNYIGNQFVCWRMTMRGNGTYLVPWNAEFLRPVRDLKLVE